jgi:hypothetical protein
LAVAAAALALAAPSAAARPIDNRPARLSEQEIQTLASRGIGAPVPATHTRTPRVESADTGFDWGSAGLGAAATGGLLLVAIGGFGAAQRARMRLAR